MVRAFDGGDDFVGVGGPREGFGLLVVLLEEAVDCRLEVDDGVEDASFEATLRQFCEEALDGIEPRAGGRCEVEGEARIAAEPGTHLGVLVSGVVVEDDVDGSGVGPPIVPMDDEPPVTSNAVRVPASEAELRLADARSDARLSGDAAALPAARATPPRPAATPAGPDWPAEASV